LRNSDNSALDLITRFVVYGLEMQMDSQCPFCAIYVTLEINISNIGIGTRVPKLGFDERKSTKWDQLRPG
jgi:hypothetical protein